MGHRDLEFKSMEWRMWLKMSIESTVEPITEIEKDDSGVVHMRYRSNSSVTLETAIRNIQETARIGGGKKVPVVVNLTGLKSVSRKARRYYSGEETAKYVSAAALVADSPVSRVLGNFFLGINKPPIPIRLFISEEKAMEWLVQFIE